MDFIKGLPKAAGKEIIWVVVDRFTKYTTILLPFPTQLQLRNWLDFSFETIYKLHRLPRSIVSDRDKFFISTFWHELFSTQLCYSSSYHPKSDGQTNRVNRCLENYLRAMTSYRPQQWIKWLPAAEWWYNTSLHSSIKMAPYEALYGAKPRIMTIPNTGNSKVAVVETFFQWRDLLNNLLKESLHQAHQRYKKYVDL